MFRIDQVTLAPGESEKRLREKVLRKLHIAGKDLRSVTVIRRSVDARKGRPVRILYSLAVEVAGAHRVKGLPVYDPKPYQFPAGGTTKLSHRPVIAGAGPCGLFAAWFLAKQGFCPLILERGKKVEERKEDLEKFWETGVLQPDSNAAFGEGGAGTFSDGKLYTSVKDPSGRGKEVLRIFTACGAPEEILYDAAPHLGTDVLFKILQKMRQELIALGAEFLFETKLAKIITEKGRVAAVQAETAQGTCEIPCEVLVLAIGHSARDTFAELSNAGLPMEEKPFAVGFRIEHPQAMIDEIQYREAAGILPPASYHLSHTSTSGRGVYSFCMCPGGYVVNAASGDREAVVNGMSYSGRGSANANSALVVQVLPSDYEKEAPHENIPALRGVTFQRRLEQEAWDRGSGRIPQQLFGDFKQDIISSEYGEFPSITKGKTEFSSLRGVLLPEMEGAFLEAMTVFGQKIVGFDRKDAILSGIESRTSSPVRILRGPNLQSEIEGIYPGGEGAGYAGGIVSAAMDGIRIAEEIAKTYEC